MPRPSTFVRVPRASFLLGLSLGGALAGFSAPAQAGGLTACQPASVNLQTTLASSDLAAPFQRELTPHTTTSEWQVELHLRSATDRTTARRLGLPLGAAETQILRLNDAQWAAVQAAGLPTRLLGGVTRHTYAYGPYPAVPPERFGAPEATASATPNVVLGTDSILLSSGSIHLAIPDQGHVWYQLQLGTESAVPAGAITTLVNYSFQLNNPAQPADFSCQDYLAILSSDAHGGPTPYHVVYDRQGGTTDGGFDDDAEDDADVLIAGRKTDAFRGEDPNQAWYLMVFDTAAEHTGVLHYFELAITWTAPELDLAATEVYFRDAPGNQGHRVDHPAPGQTLYAHVSYSASEPVSGKIWTLELDGAELCTRSADELPGAKVCWCEVPWPSALGPHTLETRLDPGDSFLERDEANNTRQHEFEVAEHADLRVEPLALEATAPTLTPLYLELDWMEDGAHSHRPSAAVIRRVQEAFAAAGYALHIDVDEAIPHQQVLDVSGSPSSSPAVQALVTQYFDRVVDPRYFYSVWGHNFSIGGVLSESSGIADLPGRVHLVTLASFTSGVGSEHEQVGTLMHEFGHNLGQRHGGADNTHYKPNYLSVMNYHYQLAPLGQALQGLGFASSSVGFGDFGFSHGLAPPLDENNLDETFGIGLGQAVDWNCNHSYETHVARDVQAEDRCKATGPLSLLEDFDNWSDLAGHVQSLAAGTRRAPEPSTPCISAEEHAPLARRLRELRALGVLPLEVPTPDTLAAPTPLGAAARRFTVFNDGAADLEVTALALDVATPWITWYPQAPWTVAPGGSQEVTVTIDFGRAPAGTTTRRLLVHSTDPDENPFPGGIDLTVTSRGHCTVATRSTPSSEGLTTGDITTSCGTPVTVKAFPQQGATFVRWTRDGAPVSTTSSYTFAATAATADLVAEFDAGGVPLMRNVLRRDIIHGTTVHGSWRYYYVDIPVGSTSLAVFLQGLAPPPPNNNVDLYLRRGQKPTLTTYDCRSIRWGYSADDCLAPPPLPGRWWIGVTNADVGEIFFAIVAEWPLPAGSTEEGKNP